MTQTTQNKPVSNISIATGFQMQPKALKEKAEQMLTNLGYKFTKAEGFWTLNQGDPRTWAQVLRKTFGKDGFILV